MGFEDECFTTKEEALEYASGFDWSDCDMKFEEIMNGSLLDVIEMNMNE